MLQLWKENSMIQSIERLAKVHKHANDVLIWSAKALDTLSYNFKIAASVECDLRNPYWSELNRLLDVKNLSTLLYTIFSSIFEKLVKSDNGR